MSTATVLYGVGYAVWLLVAPTPSPAQYTATNPAGAVLHYRPGAGWVGPEACPQGCYMQADVEHWLLRGELDVSALAGLEVTIRRNGVPVARCWTLFTTPTCEATP